MAELLWTCSKCQATNGATANFCTGCGSGRPDVDVGNNSNFCPGCGTERIGTPKYCPECGHAFDDLEAGVSHTEENTAILPLATAVSTEASAAKTARNRRIGIAAGAGGVAVLAAVGTVLLLGRDDSSDKVAAAFNGVSVSQARLDAAVKSADPNKLAPVAPAAKAVLAALDTAEHDITAVGNNGTVQTAQAAISAHRAYATSLSKVSADARRTRVADFDDAEKHRTDAQSAYATLGREAKIPVIALTGSLATVRQRVSSLQGNELRLKTFTVKLDRMLNEAANGRGEIGRVIAQTQRCELAPEDAASQIDSVADNRQSVLNQLAALPAPTPKTQQVLAALQRGLTHSREADRQYALWIRNQTSWYYLPPVGCPSGVMPRDEFFNRAANESAQSTTAKRQFVGLYNPLARRFGLRQRSESDI